MKRLLSILALGLLIFGVGFAAETDLWDWMDNLTTLSDESPFGYALNQKITVDQIAVDKVIIKSPVIKDELGNTIKKYTVIFAPYTLDQMVDNVSLLDQAKEKTFEFTTLDTTVTMELTATTDSIAPATVYYLTIIPKDQNGIFGQVSNELRFKLATQTYGEGSPDETTATHTAAGADMRLANITHTITSNRATLRWTAVDGSDRVDLFVWNPTSNAFERLSSVNMTDETYTFTLTRNGEYIVNFVPDNGGTEYRYSFIADGITATAGGGGTTPAIGKLPPTGPKENVLIALAIAVVFYIVYRRVKAKAKH